ncbi:ATP-grasp domain-containing protein [Allostreptomyces psammosilenae]|uniref:Biotin carboxylase n=1 Tax=Allostreptomyces psammosilenae TaxID=1892865 RepID=A0A852ZZV2_9ACTN|nr:ATP-grasp domain-containing protein [Allostreptomyces psammosilenae]NYI07903.1 biotin carboxylase [Allostreptomyces psammosilenae]
MGHLLMVESWVGSMSTLLPAAIAQGGHRFTFLTRNLHHYLRSAPGTGPHPLLGADNVVTAETNDPDTLLPYVERLNDVLRFDGVLTSCDYYLPVAAAAAERLGLPGPASAAVHTACRKDLTRLALAKAGVPGPRFALCPDPAEAPARAAELGYPLVVKPVDLCAGMLVRRVADERQLAEAISALDAFPVNARGQRRSPLVLLEELLEGPEVSVETVAFDGATHVVGVTDKTLAGDDRFIEAGHMFPAALDPADARAAAETALAALAAVGLDHGVAHTEIRLTAAGPRVVEINPRPAGNRITELVRHVTGIDLAAAFAETALGRAPDLTPRDTGTRSAAIAFLVPRRGGTLAEVAGADELDAPEPARLLEVHVAAPGRSVRAATSNNDYLGHVMVADTAGAGAGEHAARLLAGLTPRWADADPDGGTGPDGPAGTAGGAGTGLAATGAAGHDVVAAAR